MGSPPSKQVPSELCWLRRRGNGRRGNIDHTGCRSAPSAGPAVHARSSGPERVLGHMLAVSTSAMQREEATIHWASARPEGGEARKAVASVWNYSGRDTHAAWTASRSVLAGEGWSILVCVCVMPRCNDDQSKEARQCVGAAGGGIQPAQATCH